ncbi:hypothetical protein ACQR1W_17830 [Bradyrhizobium sp. HKCCYLS1011]|uniref:hypothetical protein n=1 Tax=Bradyrhizobium sp. HKCCYLS1011 TaxID=3420733 RepID=UPI003EBC38F5
MSDISTEDLAALQSADAALAEGDPMVARRHLATLDNLEVADEIDALIRAGLHDDAAHRLNLFINPKFPSLEECIAHIGERRHFYV